MTAAPLPSFKARAAAALADATLKTAIDRTTGEICYVAVGARIEPATVAHIHVGDAGAAGPPVLMLEQAGPHIFVGCATDPTLAEALVAAPEDYYVNIHNAPFPDGALRGQLD